MGSRPRAKLDSGLSLDIEQCKIKIKEFRISSSKQQPRDEEQFLTSVGRAVQPRLSNSLVRSLDKNALATLILLLMIIPNEVWRKRLFRVTPTYIIFQSNEKEMTQCGPVRES